MDVLGNGRSGQWTLWAMDALLNPEIHFRRVRKIAETDCEFRHVCPSVRPPVHMEQLGSHWTYFMKFDI